MQSKSSLLSASKQSAATNHDQNVLFSWRIQLSWDVIVIGSGMTGGLAAKELADKGFSVLVLEKGRNEGYADCHYKEVDPSLVPADFKSTTESDYFVQNECYMYNSSTQRLFNNDRESPYVDSPTPFTWIRTNAVGGRSLLWGGGSYRWSDLDFAAPTKDGFGDKWPICYGDLEPWYSYVENVMGVAGNLDHLQHLPNGDFLPPFHLTSLEKKMKAKLSGMDPSRQLIIGRVAALTQAHKGRSADITKNDDDGSLHFTDRHFNSLSTTLPLAMKSGRVKVISGVIVYKLEYDAKSKKVKSVLALDEATGEQCKYEGKIIFMCASTISTTHILLQSSSESFPSGLGNTSGVLGHYLMDHFSMICGVGVLYNEPMSETGSMRPTTSYLARFSNLDGSDSIFHRGYSYIGWEGSIESSAAQGGFNASDKRAIHRYKNSRTYTLMGLGECLPYYDNSVTLDPYARCKHGLPAPKIEFRFRENEYLQAESMVSEANKMLRLCGFDEVMINNRMSTGGESVHEMGTAKMGSNPTKSFLNKHNQSHDVANLFITDGSCMVTSSNIHPTLTYMALTARACEFLATEFSSIVNS
ncbi:MAG: choline dehydrogenase-like flavoprotein [Arenicella sp.]|jgi:choline dehydrogenase-like flavoprotein